MNGQATYNSNSLNTYTPETRVGIFTINIDHVSLPDKTINTYPLAASNGNVTPGSKYPSKRITIKGAVVGSSQSNLDTRIDDFKAFFSVDNKNLDINYNGVTRRYTAAIDGLPVVRRQKGLYATFEISFICQPFGIDTTSTNLFSVSNHTTETYNTTFTVGGNAPIQLPIITITIDSLTGTGDFIQISNDSNNQECLIYGLNLADGDVLILDSLNKKITKNDTEIEFYGSFITLVPGSNSLTYQDGFDTRQVDILGDYYKQYL